MVDAIWTRIKQSSSNNEYCRQEASSFAHYVVTTHPPLKSVDIVLILTSMQDLKMLLLLLCRYYHAQEGIEKKKFFFLSNRITSHHQRAQIMSAPASAEDVAEQLRIYAISDNICGMLCAAVAVTLFLWGMGYYCLCRQSNRMKVLMNQEGKQATYAAARMYDGKIIDHRITDFCKKVAAVEPRTSLKLVYRPGDNHVELDKRGVGMFCFADHGTLFLVIINPHDDLKPPTAGITYERTLNLMAGAGEDTMVAFSVYSSFSLSNADIAAAFAVDALKNHLLLVAPTPEDRRCIRE